MSDTMRAQIHRMYWEKYGVSDLGLVDATIALCMEEAARCADDHEDDMGYGKGAKIAAAIRAMAKEKGRIS